MLSHMVTLQDNFFTGVGFHTFIGGPKREGPLPVNRDAHSFFGHSKLGRWQSGVVGTSAIPIVSEGAGSWSTA